MAEYIENVLAQTSKLDWAFPFERKGQFPLDKSALFSSLEDAQKYATGSANDERKLGGTSYVGQIISVYEPANEEAGTSASVNAYIITPARGLVKLAATTASGDVAGDIADLQGKVTALLADVEALETAIGNVYTKSEVDGLIANAKDDRVDGLVTDVATLEENLGKEVERATAAEKALGERIDAIDFVDGDELADAIKDFVTDGELAEAIKDFATDSELATGLDGKVDKTTYATDKKALEDEDAAIREIAEEAKTLVNDFLTGTDTDGVVNKLKEIQAELEKLGDVVDLEAALALKADLTYVNNELAKKQDVIAENTYDAYGAAATAEQNAKDYADGLAGNYDAAGAAATAEQNAKDYADGLAGNYDAAGAAEDVKDYADETFATKAYVGTIPEGKGTDVIAYINKKAEETLAAAQGGSSETAASVKLALDNYKTENEPKFAKLEGIEAGAEVNVIETVQVNGTALGVTDKTVNIDLSAYAKQADLDTVSAQANKGVADAKTAKDAADAAQGLADTNSGKITSLEGRVETAEGKINDNAAAIATHATEFATLKGRVDGHDTAIAGKAAQADLEALQGVVGGHTTKLGTLEATTIPALEVAISAKADSTALTAEVNRAKAAEQANADAIAAIPAAILAAKNEAIAEVTNLANGAVAANTAAIENITNAETGAIAVAKAEALKAVSDLENGQVKANKEAIAILNGEAGAAGSVATIADSRIAAALAGADADFDTLKEMSDWLSTHKGSAAEMNTAILENTEAIKAINETTIPAAIATAKKYTDDTIAALKIAETYETKTDAAAKLAEAKKHTDDTIANYKVKDVDGTSLELSDAGVASVKAVSTDLLVQGELELILNGGKAN